MSDQYGYIDDSDDDDFCDHDDYDTDLLNGKCQCYRCGHSWYATTEQIDRELRFQSEYAEAMEREYRREWWTTLPARILGKLMSPFQRWHDRRLPDDDGIPF